MTERATISESDRMLFHVSKRLEEFKVQEGRCAALGNTKDLSKIQKKHIQLLGIENLLKAHQEA